MPHRLRVVLIDDEDDVRFAMEQVLVHHLPDIVAVVAFHPGDVDAIDWSGCQVAIVDLMMPGRDGESILTELAENHPDVYRVAWTAMDRHTTQRLVDEGIANAVISKPGFQDVIGLLEQRRP
jgi:DNA-binding NarL/FixJ family response regulator